jgi:lipopolysaccharide heptosyltransferase I
MSPERTADVQRSGRRILLVRLGAVGDVVRALPLAHALRAAMPDAFLGWLTEEPSAPLLREIRALDAVHVLPRRALASSLLRPSRLPSAIRTLRDSLGAMRDARYELVLDVHGTLKAAWVSTLAGAPVTGFGPGGSKELAHWMHDVSIPFPAMPMSRVRRALFLGAAAGLLGPDATPDDAAADFGLRFDDARVTRIRELPRDPRPLVVLFPFASARGQAKRWPIARHAELAERLAGRGLRAMIAWGSPREGDEARAALAGRSGVELSPRTDLVELTELLRAASVLVTGDTGPMHLAAAVGTPCVALFGPSDPIVNRPWGHPAPRGHAVMVRTPLAKLTVDEVLPEVLARLPESDR